MGQWSGKYLEKGPPRGPGHYSADGSRWWDDGHQRWFRITGAEDVLEIEVQDVDETSWAASLMATLSSQYGNGHARFVARARSADRRWPSYAEAGATFPLRRVALDDARAQGAWLQTARDRLEELHRRLVAEGWRPAGQGAHWWSRIYTRPAIDLDAEVSVG